MAEYFFQDFGAFCIDENIMIFDSISLAIALAMDAFAVSISSGIKLDYVGKREVFRISWHFGLFQILFFSMGYVAGSNLSSVISGLTGYVAFIILFLTGIHMIYEGYSGGESPLDKTDPTRGKTLVLLSVATSIDAMAAGFGFSLVKSEMLFTSACVFFVTLFLCAFGIFAGDRVSNIKVLRPFSETAGGVILVVLSVKFFFA